ncbi:hypothetical protein BJX70DRAFT_213657 [Aspergillus crustosus]
MLGKKHKLPGRCRYNTYLFISLTIHKSRPQSPPTIPLLSIWLPIWLLYGFYMSPVSYYSSVHSCGGSRQEG